MKKLLEEIKTQGYWKIRIRPAPHVANRVSNISELRPLVQQLQVEIGGWAFPHSNYNGVPITDANWVGEEVDWRGIRESWRMYQSGQIKAFLSYWFDWPGPLQSARLRGPMEPEGAALGIGDIVTRYTQCLEFAARLAMSPAGDEQMVVEVEACNLTGRHLCHFSPAAGIFWQPKVATLASYKQRQQFERATLVANARMVALDWSRELVRRFGWEPTGGVLESIYEEVTR